MEDFLSFMFSPANWEGLATSAYIIYIITTRLIAYINNPYIMKFKVEYTIAFIVEMITWNMIVMVTLCDSWPSVIVPLIFISLTIAIELFVKNKVNKSRSNYISSDDI